MHDLVKDIHNEERSLAPILRAWLEKGGKIPNALGELMTRKALAGQDNSEALAFIHEVREGFTPHGREEKLRGRRLLDQAAEKLCDAKMKLMAIELDEERRNLHIFISRAELLTAEEMEELSQTPGCTPSEGEGGHKGKNAC